MRFRLFAAALLIFPAMLAAQMTGGGNDGQQTDTVIEAGGPGSDDFFVRATGYRCAG